MSENTTVPLYQVDAFADQAFRGNPAAVCLYEQWLPDGFMQAVAAENNLSETAFVVPQGEDGDDWELRWFTPLTEVDLCGHATLASAYVLFHEVDPDMTEVTFHTKSGPLVVKRDGDWIVLDFPARPGVAVSQVPESLVRGVGVAPRALFESEHNLLAVLESEDQVAELAPDMNALLELEHSVIATAPGDDCDFVSRYFAPRVGVPEDPVTGSAHCTLTPHWANALGKSRLDARQISNRGGVLRCEAKGARVEIAGQGVLVIRGELVI